MNGAVYLRTVKDQARIRTFVFLIILVAGGFIAGWGPLAAFDQLSGEAADAETQEERAAQREEIDSASSLAIFLGFPVLNAKVVLLLFATLTSVSATASEWQNRTVFLLFSKPVSRWRIVLSKVLGAYTWVAGGVLLAGLAMVIGGGVSGMAHPFTGQFVVGLLWVALAMLPFVTIASMMGVVTRKTIPAVFACILLLGFAAPAAGQAGFMIAMRDEEFKAEGIYPDDSWEVGYECTQDDPLHDQPLYEADTEQELDDAWEGLQKNYAAVQACREEALGEVDAFYIERGAPIIEMEYERDWCRTTITYEAWNGQGNEPHYNRTPLDHQPCFDRDFSESDNPYLERSIALRSKFERPLVDAPRFLTPTTSLSSWQPVTGWSPLEGSPLIGLVIGPNPIMQVVYGENAVGSTPVPSSVAGSVIGLVLHGVLWPLLTVLVINRRDLS